MAFVPDRDLAVLAPIAFFRPGIRFPGQVAVRADVDNFQVETKYIFIFLAKTISIRHCI